MTAPAFPPIRYIQRDARLLLRFARFLEPGSKPTVEDFGLEPDGKGGFLWIPR